MFFAIIAAAKKKAIPASTKQRAANITAPAEVDRCAGASGDIRADITISPSSPPFLRGALPNQSDANPQPHSTADASSNRISSFIVDLQPGLTLYKYILPRAEKRSAGAC